MRLTTLKYRKYQSHGKKTFAPNITFHTIINRSANRLTATTLAIQNAMSFPPFLMWGYFFQTAPACITSLLHTPAAFDGL